MTPRGLRERRKAGKKSKGGPKYGKKLTFWVGKKKVSSLRDLFKKEVREARRNGKKRALSKSTSRKKRYNPGS